MLDGDVIEFGKEGGRKEFFVDGSKVSVVLLGAFEALLQSKGRKNSAGIGFGAAPPRRKNRKTGNAVPQWGSVPGLLNAAVLNGVLKQLPD